VTKISSSWTAYNKKLLPRFIFGFLIVFLVIGLFADKPRGVGVMLIVMPLFMMAFVYFVYRKLVWDLADEVYDCGDSLLVRNQGKEERIHLSNVMNVNVSMFVHPQRISLRLDKPGPFGNEIAFLPRLGFTTNPFAKNKLGEDLIARVDQARRKRAI
jgi:hypothetical protein